MSSEIQTLQQRISVKNEELTKRNEIVDFYQKLAAAKSDSAGLSILQLLLDRINHLTEFHNLLLNDFTLIQPVIFATNEHLKQTAEHAKAIIDETDAIKVKIADDETILEAFVADELAERIRNLYQKETFGGAEQLAVRANVVSGRTKVNNKSGKITDYSVDQLSIVDVRGLQTEIVQKLASSIEVLASHISSSVSDAVLKKEGLDNEIEQLGKEKLQLEFEQKKLEIFSESVAEAPSQIQKPKLQQKLDALNAAKVAHKKATDEFEAANTAVTILRGKLNQLQEHEQLTLDTKKHADTVSETLNALSTQLEALNTAIKPDMVKDLGKLATTLASYSEGAETIFNRVSEANSSSSLIDNLRTIVTMHKEQLQLGNLVTDKENDLKEVFSRISEVLENLFTEDDSILKTLKSEFKESIFGNSLEDAITELQVGSEAQEALKTQLEEKGAERTAKQTALDIASRALMNATSVFETADSFWD